MKKAQYMQALESAFYGSTMAHNALLSLLCPSPLMTKQHIILHAVFLRRIYKRDARALCAAFLDNLHNFIGKRSAPMRSSAQVCLQDARACYERGLYGDGIKRATKGLLYLGFVHLNQGRATC